MRITAVVNTRGQLMLGWETEADLGWSLRSDLALGTLQVWQVDKNGESFWDVEVEYMRNGSTATYRLERTYDSSGRFILSEATFKSRFVMRRSILLSLGGWSGRRPSNNWAMVTPPREPVPGLMMMRGGCLNLLIKD